MEAQDRQRVAIIGGGAAGAIVACELLRRDAPIDVDVYEPRAELGRGLAYSTEDDQHVVNVPAAKLSAVADDPGHLVRWLAGQGHDARDEAFPRRSVYGRYVAELIANRAAAATRCRLSHRRATATGVRSVDGELLVASDVHAEPARYAHVVIALGNVTAPPAIPLPVDPRCFATPWEDGALVAAPEVDAPRLLVVGTGLTAVDAALSLVETMPHAAVTMVSRNGHLPYPHLPGPLRTPFASDGFPTDLCDLDALCAAWEQHVADGLAAGHDWRDVVDGLRPRTQQVWRALDDESQGRFLREHRRAWETRRNRAAPQVGSRLAELVEAGRLRVRAGHVEDLRSSPDGVRARVAGQDETFDRVVSCTGPTSDVTRTTNPLLRDLFGSGIASPDVHRLGIRTGTDGQLRDADGRVDDRISTLGWLRRGELWETLAIPEIREQATVIAGRIAP